jgi:hypothetical protein
MAQSRPFRALIAEALSVAKNAIFRAARELAASTSLRALARQ